ncbi:MAG: deoxyribonuclease IV [Bacteroidota bacterium]
MRFGVHVSIGDGFLKAVQKAEHLGCETFQIFAGNPRGWARKPLDAAEAERFKAARLASGLGPVVVHLSYLPNLANLDDQLFERSVLAMGEDFARANLLGADYFVVHPGSCAPEAKAEGMRRVMRGVEAVLAQVAGPTRLLLENQGSRKRDLGADLSELASMAAGLDRDRVGICLDTCHAFVAGYDLRTEAGWREALAMIAGGAGLDRLGLIHGNDSRGDLGSGLDRHEHIGAGYLGAPAFAAMGGIDDLADRAVILETPQESPADDLRNLAAIRALAGGKA